MPQVQLSFQFESKQLPVATIAPEESMSDFTREQQKYLLGPVVQTPGGWSTTLPKMYFENIVPERLALLRRVGSELLATELECLIYMYGHVMNGPPSEDYFQIYMYLAKRVCTSLQKRDWPLKEYKDELGSWRMDQLKRLSGDIRRSVVKNSKR